VATGTVAQQLAHLLQGLRRITQLLRVQGVEGRFFEHYISEPGLGIDLSAEEFYRIGTRIFTLERALQIAEAGRLEVPELQRIAKRA